MHLCENPCKPVLLDILLRERNECMRRILILTTFAWAVLALNFLHAATLLTKQQPKIKMVVRQADPLLTHLYDGANRTKLAESSRGAVNEEELLLFLLVSGDHRPAIYDDYMNETDAMRKADLQKQLQSRINDYYYRLSFSEMDQGPNLTDFEQKKVDALLCPAVEFVWLDRTIRPRVDVTPNEMRLYYRNHPEEFITPHLVHVRYIFRRLDPTMSRDEVDAEEKLMDSLREVLEQHPEKFADAARQYSHAPSAVNGGEIAPFAEGEYFAQFEKVAFGLSIPDEISSIFSNEEGLFLMQLIGHTMPNAIEYDAAQDKVRKSALKQEMTHMARYAMTRLHKEARVENRFSLWNDLRDEDMIARVNERSVTKGDFWRLFPSVIDVMGNPSVPERAYQSKRYIECELMRQDLKDKGLWEDPRLMRAEELARIIVKADRVESRHLREKMIVDANEPAAAAAPAPTTRSNGVLFNGTQRVRLFKIEGRLVEPERLDATTIFARREELQKIMNGYMANATLQPADAEPLDRAGKVPVAVRGIKGIDDERFAFEWEDIGWADSVSKPELQSWLMGAGEGQFSPIRAEGDKATALYVAAQRALSAEEKEQLEMRARRVSAQRSRDEAIELFREGVAQTQNITYTF